jgi:hypothetical protein
VEAARCPSGSQSTSFSSESERCDERLHFGITITINEFMNEWWLFVATERLLLIPKDSEEVSIEEHLICGLLLLLPRGAIRESDWIQK